MPIVSALFPGINYYSITGFQQVKMDLVIPVLKKYFPELQSMDVKNINPKEKVEIRKFLPSDGYEWQDSYKWEKKIQTALKEEVVILCKTLN